MVDVQLWQMKKKQRDQTLNIIIIYFLLILSERISNRYNMCGRTACMGFTMASRRQAFVNPIQFGREYYFLFVK